MSSPRILMLPGYTQSATIFAGRIGALRKSLKNTCEMVFIDPTHIIDRPTFGNQSDFDSVEKPTKDDELPRGWYYGKDSTWVEYEKFDESLEYLKNILKEQGPFDAVWGFSQGACMAAVITSLVETDPEWQSIHPPFKYSILVSGLYPKDPTAVKCFPKTVTTPSLHVLGKNDVIVSEAKSLELYEHFDKSTARLEYHDGSHHTPSKAPWRNFLKAYIEAFKSEDGLAKALSLPSP